MPRGILPQVATCISYEEFSGDKTTGEDFSAWLARFARMPVVYAACVINVLLETWSGSINSEAHEALVRDAFFPDDAHKLLELCKTPGNQRFVFHRLQVLLVAKEALLHCPEDGINPFKTPNWGGLGIAFLMASDLTYREFPSPKTREEQVLQALAQTIPVTEYSSRYNLGNRVARYHLMLSRFTRGSVGQSDLDIGAEFHRVTGLDPRLFASLCVGVMSHYIASDYRKLRGGETGLTILPTFFDSAAVSKTSIDLFLNEIAAPLDKVSEELQEKKPGLLDMTVLRSWPLWVYPDGGVFAPDIRFVIEKLESGIFWRVHNSLPDRKRSALHQLWGETFERYVNWMLQDAVDPKVNLFYPSPKYRRTGVEACDGIIVCGNEAILLEYKGRTFRSQAKYGMDVANLSEEIEEHLIGSETKPKGVAQLANAIKKLFDPCSQVELDNVDLSNVRKVFPVLVTRDDLGGCFGMSHYLNIRFQKLINKKRYKRLTVTPMFCMSVEALEVISAYLAKAKISKILEARYQNDPGLYASFLAIPNNTLAALGDLENKSLNSTFMGIMNETKSTFFPEGTISSHPEE